MKRRPNMQIEIVNGKITQVGYGYWLPGDKFERFLFVRRYPAYRQAGFR